MFKLFQQFRSMAGQVPQHEGVLRALAGEQHANLFSIVAEWGHGAVKDSDRRYHLIFAAVDNARCLIQFGCGI